MIRAAVALAALLLSKPVAAQTKETVDPYAPGREVVADIARIVTPNGVQETFETRLGGARQIVNVRGADRANPIILFLHGGPGAVEMPMAWTFQRPWEDYFTMVQWDQRGAGRSYPLNDPAQLTPTLTLERYRDDAIELIETLKKRYGQRKVILMGHSWGSIVGLSVAEKRPDLLHAYVGIGQLIDFRESERVGFDWTLAKARADGNAEAIGELEAIRPYPGAGPFDIGKMSIQRKWSVHYGALAAGRDNARFYFNATQISPDYSAADIESWSLGSAFTIKTLFPKLSAISFTGVRRLRVPIVLLLGRHDYTIPSPLAEAWLSRLDAPYKRAVWFEHSAHLPFIEEPGRVFAALLDFVRPLTRGKR